jgi:hypothetical protein
MHAGPRDRKHKRRSCQPDQTANLSDAFAAFLLSPLGFSAGLHATVVPCSPGNARAAPASGRGTGSAERGTDRRR